MNLKQIIAKVDAKIKKCQLQFLLFDFHFILNIMNQFNVKNGDELSCALYQRSNDEALGTCFNIASYSFLTHLLAKHCGLRATEFIYFKGDCHIYEDHIEPMKEQKLT